MEAFAAGLGAAFAPQILLLVVAGTLLGIVVGALPGISGSTTTALLLPLTITMSPTAAVAFLGSIYCAANYGGSITAILINTPGDPSASATAFDGYPLARRGEAGRALGMSAVASAIGGIFSVVVLIVAAPLLARLAYQFGPPEYFALALFGLSMVAAVGGDSPAKNLMGGASGVLLATIGLDLTTGVERFSFGVPALADGLGFIPVLVGLFAISELFERMSQRGVVQESIKLKAMDLPTWADFRKCGKAITLSSVIGTFIGILPALGATTAIILAGLMIQGVRPGPHLFSEQPTLLYVVFGSMLACNLLYLVLGFAFAKGFARITLIPDAYLWPGVFILSVVGAYAPNQSMVDVVIMLAFGVVGFLFKRYGFSPAPLIMGLVLGKMVEETLKQSLLLFDQDWTLFFVRPVVVVLFAITAAGLLAPPLWRAWQRTHQRPQLQ